MKAAILFLSIILTLLSCKKEEYFIHEPAQILSPCVCCDLADTVVGQYTGHLIMYDHSNWTQSNPVPGTVILDSIITIDITRDLSNSDFASDSLFCWFNIPYFFNEPVSVTSNGNIEQPHYNFQTLKHDYYDSTFRLKLRNGYYPVPPTPFGNSYYLTTYEFVGIRQ